MVWKCPPLNLPNWNNHWKWKEDMSKRTIKIDSYAWIMENGVISYGFYLGDGDEPVEFAITLKEIIRNTLESYRLNSGDLASYHLEDMHQLSRSMQLAKSLIDNEIKRMGSVEEND